VRSQQHAIGSSQTSLLAITCCNLRKFELRCWQRHATEGRSRTTLLLATTCNRRKFENFAIVCTFKLDVDALRERTCNHKMQQNQSRLRFLRSSLAACSNRQKERTGSSSTEFYSKTLQMIAATVVSIISRDSS